MAVGLDREGTITLRDRIEDELLAPAIARGFKRFLARLEKAALASIYSGRESLTAAAEAFYGQGSDEGLSLGTTLKWWGEEIGEDFTEMILESISLAYESREGTVRLSGLEGAAEYLVKVRDRLVYPTPVLGVTAPADAFNLVRMVVADSEVLGWSRNELAERINLELGWSAPDHSYWKGQQKKAASRLDAILDEYGPPGTPAREFMRENDPTVAALQADHAKATLRLDADQSVWEGRAKMIARTESTGVANYVALQALAEEGAVGKEWIAAHDSRTREEHAAADGQIVALDKPFNVGGYQLQMPGDPAAPAHLVINCRCTIVGVDDLNPVGEEPVETPVTEAAAEPEPEPVVEEVGPGWWDLPADEYAGWDEEYTVDPGNWERDLRRMDDPEYHEAWTSYIQLGYEDYNAALRGGAELSPEDSRKLTKLLDLYDSKVVRTFPEEGYVVRGTRAWGEGHPGDVLVDRGFVSTTNHIGIAEGFQGREGYLYVMKVPEGTKYLPGVADEFEYIFKPGTEMVVKRRDELTKTIYVEIRG